MVPRERVVPERIVQARRGRSPQDSPPRSRPPHLGEVLFALIAEKLDGTADPHLRGRGHRNRPARRPATASPTTTTPTPTSEVLVEQGQPIGEEQLILLPLEHEEAVRSLGFSDRLRRGLGILAMVAALFLLTGYYALRHERRFASDPRRIALICGLVILTPGIVRVLADADLGRRAGPRRHRGDDRSPSPTTPTSP